MKHIVIVNLLASVAIITPSQVQAQSSDVIVMRRVIASPNRSVTPSPTPTPTASPTPAPPTEVPDPRPTPTPSPTPSSTPARAYDWIPDGTTGAWESTCSNSTRRPLNHACQRDDGQIVEDSFCPGAEPVEYERKSNYDGCATQWVAGLWTDYSSFCSKTATRTRTVDCQALVPGDHNVQVDEARCTQPRISETDVETTVTTGCNIDINGDFETGTTNGWSTTASYFVVTSYPANRHGGKYAADISKGPVAAVLPYRQTGLHTLSFWVRTQNGTKTNVTADLLENGTSIQTFSTGANTSANVWTNRSFTFTVRAGNTYHIRFQASDTYDFFVDDVTFAAVP